MADKKPEPPKPSGYHPSLNLSIDDAVKGYRDLHTEESRKKYDIERGYDNDDLYQSHLAHFKQHGQDDKTKRFKRLGYSDMKDMDKRKWVATLLKDWAKVGMTKEYGKEAAEQMLKHHDLIKQYVEQKMLTDDLKSYEAIIEHFGEIENLKDAYRNDEQVKAVFESYLQRINGFPKAKEGLRDRLNNAAGNKDEYVKLASYVNGVLKPHKKKLGPHAPVPFLVNSVEASAAENFKPPKKSRYLEDLVDDKVTSIKKAA